jgi:hypothetical protein
MRSIEETPRLAFETVAYDGFRERGRKIVGSVKYAECS